MENQNTSVATFEYYSIEPIHEKYVWRICDLMTVNATRFQQFFPSTLQQTLTPTLSQIFVEQKLCDFKNREEFLFVLKEKVHKTVIGLVYIKKLDWVKKRAEIAYCIGYQYEGKGMMTQTVKALSTYAFETLQLKTLEIIVHKSNLASIKVAEKSGYLWKRTMANEFAPANEAPLDMELYERYA